VSDGSVEFAHGLEFTSNHSPTEVFSNFTGSRQLIAKRVDRPTDRVPSLARSPGSMRICDLVMASLYSAAMRSSAAGPSARPGTLHETGGNYYPAFELKKGSGEAGATRGRPSPSGL
jgi:hypothetical protein